MGTTRMALTPHGTTPPAYDAVNDFIPLARIGVKELGLGQGN